MFSVWGKVCGVLSGVFEVWGILWEMFMIVWGRLGGCVRRDWGGGGVRGSRNGVGMRRVVGLMGVGGWLDSVGGVRM